MLTKHFARKYVPEELPVKLLTNRLQQEQYLDLPITKAEQDQMNFSSSASFVSGEPIHLVGKRLENMRLHRLFATLPRPKGLDETKEWIKPAW